mmetsp:Transcript_23637/g.67817  ORF Transcript_23637/g.67817 Transcript_23637/m.67817 type:complete len:547 (+) Transcript_23637:1105-2745(+)
MFTCVVVVVPPVVGRVVASLRLGRRLDSLAQEVQDMRRVLDGLQDVHLHDTQQPDGVAQADVADVLGRLDVVHSPPQDVVGLVLRHLLVERPAQGLGGHDRCGVRRIVLVLELQEELVETDVSLRLLHRIACILDLGPDRQLLLRIAGLLLRRHVGVHDNREEHIEKDEQDQELEAHDPDGCVVVVDQLHGVDVELTHEDPPAHHHRLVLVLEALDRLSEDNIGRGREAKENGGEDDQEVDNLHGRPRERADDDVQPRVRLERLEELHHQDECVPEHQQPQRQVFPCDLRADGVHVFDAGLVIRHRDDALNMVRRQVGPVFEDQCVQCGGRQHQDAFLELAADQEADLDPASDHHCAQDDRDPVDKVPELQVLDEAVEAAADRRDQLRRLGVEHSQQDCDEDRIHHDVRLVVVRVRLEGLHVDDDLHEAGLPEIKRHVAVGECLEVRVVVQRMGVQHRGILIDPAVSGEVLDLLVEVVQLQVVHQELAAVFRNAAPVALPGDCVVETPQGLALLARLGRRHLGLDELKAPDHLVVGRHATGVWKDV